MTRDRKHTIQICLVDAIIVLVMLFIATSYTKRVPYWFWPIATSLWMFVSVLFQKFKYSAFRHTRSVVTATFLVNLLIFFVIYWVAKWCGLDIGMSWKIVVLYFVMTLLELELYSLYKRFYVVEVNYYEEEKIGTYFADSIQRENDSDTNVKDWAMLLFEKLQEDYPYNPVQWKQKHSDDFGGGVKILATPTMEELETLSGTGANNILNISKFNDIRYINRYFIKLNSILPDKGIFAIGGVVSDVRKQTIYDTYPPVISKIVYFFDFVWNRMFPKMIIFKKLYFSITKGKHRVFPRSEIMGRLYSCGFEIVSEQVVKDHFFVVVQKTKPPFDDKNPSYGPLIRLRRVGKGGKMIGVFKFRTMHAYSEYLQAYIYKHNSLQEGGKIADDYRVSTIGHFLRKYWLDEVPMILNILRGDLKLVGVRPLSKHYYSLYTPEMQELHIKVKPGLLPPFYVDMPKTLEEVQESEKKYIEQYLEHPFRTDWNYFWKIVKNIVFKHKHSA
ncbi:MAG: sugar transferase [Bacteroidales bacterium]|nr:sugar transferase [Bacteroidales bacterium]